MRRYFRKRERLRLDGSPYYTSSIGLDVLMVRQRGLFLIDGARGRSPHRGQDAESLGMLYMSVPNLGLGRDDPTAQVLFLSPGLCSLVSYHPSRGSFRGDPRGEIPPPPIAEQSAVWGIRCLPQVCRDNSSNRHDDSLQARVPR